MLYQYENGRKEVVPFTEDIYMQGFLKNYFLRESCYNCQMRFDKKNSADIIIGDFWGIENVFPEMDDDKGISAVILNSAKGKEVFQKLEEKIELKETTFEAILKANPVLTSSVAYTKNREKFFSLVENNEVETSIQVIKGIEADKEIEKKEQENAKLRGEISILNQQIKDLLDAKEYFLGQLELKDTQIEGKAEELQKIYYSRRWKYTSKIAEVVNKIRRKKG